MERQIEHNVQKKAANVQYSSSASSFGGNRANAELHAATQRKQSVEQNVCTEMKLASKYALHFQNNQFRVAGKNFAGQVSQIAGVIWDDFKEMSTIEKILALLGTSVVVGAVAYFDWKVIRGNWNTISNFATEEGGKLAINAREMVERLQNNPVIKALLHEFGGREENPNFNADIAKKVYEGFHASGYEAVVKKFLEMLPVFMAGSFALKQGAALNKHQDSDDDEFAV